MYCKIIIFLIICGTCLGSPTKNAKIPEENASDNANTGQDLNESTLHPIEVLIDTIDLGPLKILGKQAEVENFGNRSQIYKTAIEVDSYFTRHQIYQTRSFWRPIEKIAKEFNVTLFVSKLDEETSKKMMEMMDKRKMEIGLSLIKELEEKDKLKKEFKGYLADLKAKLTEINALVEIERAKYPNINFN